MGRLYDAIQSLDDIIRSKGLDTFRVKGEISMRTGFLMGFVEPDDPDDEEKLRDLAQAASEILGMPISF
jgi:hypothetical protein